MKTVLIAGILGTMAAAVLSHMTDEVHKARVRECERMVAHNAAVEFCYVDDYVCATTVEDWSQYRVYEARIARMCTIEE